MEYQQLSYVAASEVRSGAASRCAEVLFASLFFREDLLEAAPSWQMSGSESNPWRKLLGVEMGIRGEARQVCHAGRVPEHSFRAIQRGNGEGVFYFRISSGAGIMCLLLTSLLYFLCVVSVGKPGCGGFEQR